MSKKEEPKSEGCNTDTTPVAVPYIGSRMGPGFESSSVNAVNEVLATLSGGKAQVFQMPYKQAEAVFTDYAGTNVFPAFVADLCSVCSEDVTTGIHMLLEEDGNGFSPANGVLIYSDRMHKARGLDDLGFLEIKAPQTGLTSSQAVSVATAIHKACLQSGAYK